MKITKQMMVDAHACYTDEQLNKISNGKSLTHEEVAALDIPINDRYWALSIVMTPEQNRRCARRIALDVIHLWDAPDVVIRYLETGDESLRAATWAAAWDATRVAAWDDAGDATRDAAWDATRAAAWAAAWASAQAAARDAALAATRAAAWAAARAAAWDATRDAAREKYLSWMVEELNP